MCCGRFVLLTQLKMRVIARDNTVLQLSDELQCPAAIPCGGE